MAKRGPIQDLLKGIEDRKVWAAKVNGVLKGEARLERIHEYLQVQDGHQAWKNNTLPNRIFGADGNEDAESQSMGLDYFLTLEGEANQFIVMRRATDSDVYYKIPRSVDEENFVRIILSQMHFLFLNKTFTRYALLHGKDYNWLRSTTKGNRSRLSAIFTQGPYRGQKVNPKRDAHWASILEDQGKKPTAFALGEGFVPVNVPMKKALLGIIRRGRP